MNYPVPNMRIAMLRRKDLKRSNFRQRGVGLIEVLVTMLVLSIGLLGLAGLQTEALRLNHNALLETKAHIFASDIAERMRLSRQPTAYLRKYSDPIPNANDCTAQICDSAAELAAWDLEEWLTRLEDQLPSGQAQIILEDAAYGEYSVTVRYDDQRGAADAGSDANAFREVMVVTRL